MFSSNKRGRKAEERCRDETGGRLTPGSGSIRNFKGDVQADRFLIESKATANASFSVKAAIWRKIEHEAMMAGKLPAMRIEIEGCPPLYIIAVSEFQELLEDSNADDYG